MDLKKLSPQQKYDSFKIIIESDKKLLKNSMVKFIFKKRISQEGWDKIVRNFAMSAILDY